MHPRAAALLLVVFVVLIGLLFIPANYTNVQAPAGYAAYIVERPLVGQTSFAGVITGPSSTGLSWRKYGNLVSITPYSYSEDFSNVSALIARDKLPISGNAHIVFRIRSAPDQIRTYMERYGGLDESHTADFIAQESYSNYVKEPFRTLVREEFARYDGLAVPEHFADMGNHIAAELTEKLRDTPFEVIQVVIGNAQPPAVVLEQIALKVAKTQELERKNTEQQIAAANLAIEEANGRAAGAKELAIAEAKAQANLTLSKSLTPELLQYEAIQMMKGAERIYVPVGTNGLPLVGQVPVGSKNEHP